jgi:hypothetical protein
MDKPPIIESPQQAILPKSLPPQDIVFRLAALAAFNMILFWLPIYYMARHDEPDDRRGIILIVPLTVCLVACFPTSKLYVQAWRRELPVRFRIAFLITCTILAMIDFSPLTAVGYASIRVFLLMTQ